MGKLLPTDAKIRLQNRVPPDFTVELSRIMGRDHLTVVRDGDRAGGGASVKVGECFDEKDIQWLGDMADKYRPVQ